MVLIIPSVYWWKWSGVDLEKYYNNFSLYHKYCRVALKTICLKLGRRRSYQVLRVIDFQYLHQIIPATFLI